MSTSGGENFEVTIEEFAGRHFVKQFHKKYKKAWNITENAIIAELKRVDNIIGCNDYVEIIKSNCDTVLIKLYFKIAGTNESKKSSGNRAIVFADMKNRNCKILLVYSKNDICPPNETQKWQTLVRENYQDLQNYL
jgi:hypothetical protein